MERRKVLKLIASGALLEPLSALAAPAELSEEDDAFLDELIKAGCLYFTEQVGEKTGQVLDRAVADNPTGKRDPRFTSSIAATGFGLSALCIADRHALPPARLDRRAGPAHARLAPERQHAARCTASFTHFNDVDMGGSFRGSEVSPIDTSILLCGVLTARAHFRTDPVIVELATRQSTSASSGPGC